MAVVLGEAASESGKGEDCLVEVFAVEFFELRIREKDLVILLFYFNRLKYGQGFCFENGYRSPGMLYFHN